MVNPRKNFLVVSFRKTHIFLAFYSFWKYFSLSFDKFFYKINIRFLFYLFLKKKNIFVFICWPFVFWMGKNWGILCPYFSCFYVYKGFFSGFSPLLSEKVKRGREWLFFRKLSGDFFVGFCRNRPKRENIFWESGFYFVFFSFY